LFQGVGEYWSANLITAMSGNAVRVGSVVPGGARLVPYIWVQDRHFYRERPQFAVWQEPNETGVTEKLVRSTWHVCRLDRVHGYWIATLRTGLSSGLCPRASGETNVTNGIPFS
jgi:hypothetical protein